MPTSCAACPASAASASARSTRWHPEDAAWDGVGEIWFDSVEAAEAAFRAEPHISRLIADRALFIGEAQWCFVEEHTAVPPPV